MLLANVLWPFHGAFLAQLIPFFLVIEWLILARFFKEIGKARALGAVLLANLGSTIVGYALVTPLQLLGWDGLTQKASEQFGACLVAFAMTVPLEHSVIRAFPGYVDRKRLWRGVFYMNFATYSICFAFVAYHWHRGDYAGP